jgi:hypothetical protein
VEAVVIVLEASEPDEARHFTLHAWKRSPHYSLYYSLTVVSLETKEPQVV